VKIAPCPCEDYIMENVRELLNACGDQYFAESVGLKTYDYDLDQRDKLSRAYAVLNSYRIFLHSQDDWLIEEDEEGPLRMPMTNMWSLLDDLIYMFEQYAKSNGHEYLFDKFKDRLKVTH
jgi:hypothetical protein